MRRRIGLSIMPLETRLEAIIGLATEGDRLGYDGFFMPETWAYYRLEDLWSDVPSVEVVAATAS